MTAELRMLDLPPGKVPGTGMDKPQRPAIPDAARQGMTEGASTSSQPATAKFKSVPKEASGTFKAPSKAALLNLAAKQGDHPPRRHISSPLPSHTSSTKLQGLRPLSAHDQPLAETPPGTLFLLCCLEIPLDCFNSKAHLSQLCFRCSLAE